MKAGGAGKKKSSYDLLLISEHAPVRRIRLHRFWVRLLVLLLLAMTAGIAGAGYVAVHSLNAMQALKERNVDLEQRLDQSRVRLDRLQNVEKMLDSYDPGVVGPLVKQPAAPLMQADQEAPTIDLTAIFQDLDLARISIKNMQAGMEEHHVELSFEINNLEENETAKGAFSYAVITRDGRVIEVVNQGGEGFQIKYFKRIKTKLILPEGIDSGQLFGVQLTVNDTTGATLFRETYPLTRILV